MDKNEQHNRLLKVFDRLLDDEEIGKCKSDAIALYYAYSKHQWKDQLSVLKIPEAANLLGISPDRIRKARKVLLRLSLISLHTIPDDKGIVRHYVQVHYV